MKKLTLMMCISLLATAGNAAFPRYRVTDLRTWQYGSAFFALNNHGDMTGWTTPTRRLMVADSTGVHQYAGAYPYSQAVGISITDSGVVGGYTITDDPYLWSKAGGFSALPRYGTGGGGVGSIRFEVNEYNESLGLIAGTAETNVGFGSFAGRAVRWINTNGNWSVEQSPSGNGNVMWYGLDMDANGRIIGYGNKGAAYVAQYWDAGSNQVMNLQSTPGWTAFAFGTDANGSIYGEEYRSISGVISDRILIWNDPLAAPIQVPTTILPNGFFSNFRVNQGGWLAGTYGTAYPDIHAGMWSAENGFASIADLVEPGTPFHDYLYVQDLNDNGSMIVQAKVPGQQVYYNLRLDPVPEPTSLLLLTPGLAWVVMRRRKRVNSKVKEPSKE